jgi:gamma-glutamylcyclotransferase (GGCT)/AIG2-like uncharacterized protein YtfP/GNAT superfamily N-acetyltransferase
VSKTLSESSGSNSFAAAVEKAKQHLSRAEGEIDRSALTMSDVAKHLPADQYGARVQKIVSKMIGLSDEAGEIAEKEVESLRKDATARGKVLSDDQAATRPVVKKPIPGSSLRKTKTPPVIRKGVANMPSQDGSLRDQSSGLVRSTAGRPVSSDGKVKTVVAPPLRRPGEQRVSSTQTLEGYLEKVDAVEPALASLHEADHVRGVPSVGDLSYRSGDTVTFGVLCGAIFWSRKIVSHALLRLKIAKSIKSTHGKDLSEREEALRHDLEGGGVHGDLDPRDFFDLCRAVDETDTKIPYIPSTLPMYPSGRLWEDHGVVVFWEASDKVGREQHARFFKDVLGVDPDSLMVGYVGDGFDSRYESLVSFSTGRNPSTDEMHRVAADLARKAHASGSSTLRRYADEMRRRAERRVDEAVVDREGLSRLYHVTPLRNVESIRRLGINAVGESSWRSARRSPRPRVYFATSREAADRIRDAFVEAIDNYYEEKYWVVEVDPSELPEGMVIKTDPMFRGGVYVEDDVPASAVVGVEAMDDEENLAESFSERVDRDAVVRDLLSRAGADFDKTDAAVEARAEDQEVGDDEGYLSAFEYWLADEHGIDVRDDGLVTVNEPFDDDARQIVGDNWVVMYHHTATGKDGRLARKIGREGLVASKKNVNRNNLPSSGVYLTTRSGDAAANGYLYNARQKHGGDERLYSVVVKLSELAPDSDDEDIDSGRYQAVVDEVPTSRILDERVLCERWQVSPEQNPGDYLGDGPDEYYYHVTNKASFQKILSSGLKPNVDIDDADWSYGKAFLCNRDSVDFWYEYVDMSKLDDDNDEPVILRIPKSDVDVELQRDELGSKDAQSDVWYATALVEDAKPDVKFSPKVTHHYKRSHWDDAIFVRAVVGDESTESDAWGDHVETSLFQLMDPEEPDECVAEEVQLPGQPGYTIKAVHRYASSSWGDAVQVNARHGGKNVGIVHCLRINPKDLLANCRADVDALLADLGEDVAVFYVDGSGVDEAHRGKGVGALLYATAVQELGKRRAILVASKCYFDEPATSRQARVVWENSSQLRRVARVVGFAAASRTIKSADEIGEKKAEHEAFMKRRWEGLKPWERDHDEFREYLRKTSVPDALADAFMKRRRAGRVDESVGVERARLFLYGTLRNPYARRRAAEARTTSAPASLPGYKRRSVAVDGEDYPDLATDAEASVRGRVVEVSPAVLARIDEWEERYERREVELADGSTAFAYFLVDAAPLAEAAGSIAAPSPAELHRRYQKYNGEIFDWELPNINIALGRRSGANAWLKTMVSRATGKVVSMEMYFSKSLRLSPEKLDGLLLHEMIHVKMMVDGHLHEDHGPRFQAERRRIEAMGHLVLMEHASYEGERPPRDLVYAIATRDDGERFLGAVGINLEAEVRAGAPEYAARLPKRYHVDFYRATHPIGNKITRSRSFKTITYYEITDEEVASIAAAGKKIGSIEGAKVVTEDA